MQDYELKDEQKRAAEKRFGVGGLTVSPLKAFRPGTEQVRLAELLLVAMAIEAHVRPIVEAYESAILQKHQFRIARKWVEKGCNDVIILDRKRSYLLEDTDAEVFHSECFAARDAAKLTVERPDKDPLLEAQHRRIEAENALLESMATIPGLENFATGHWPLQLRQKAIDLTLKLLAPFVRSGEAIMQDLMPH